ncbi:MAG: hypothetical protein D3907_03820, partial [Candidatus Electrothrix sp. AUS3]|nr:hypothetical protein [Candidatus Electrothrix gigas]
TLLDPAGKKVPLKSINSIEYETEEALSTPGVYTIAAQRKAVFRQSCIAYGELLRMVCYGPVSSEFLNF